VRVKLPTSGPARIGTAVGAVLVLAAAGIAAGLLLTPAEHEPEPGANDHYAEAPGCGAVESALPDDAVPGGELDSDALRPLSAGQARQCTWTSVDDPEAAPRWLQVDVEVHYGEEPDGAELAARHWEELRGEHSRDRDDFGSAGLLRPDVEGVAEAAFHRENLLVRVRYADHGGDDGEPMDTEEVEEKAAEVAAAVDAAL
jgi:hypothetical protein